LCLSFSSLVHSRNSFAHLFLGRTVITVCSWWLCIHLTWGTNGWGYWITSEYILGFLLLWLNSSQLCLTRCESPNGPSTFVAVLYSTEWTSALRVPLLSSYKGSTFLGYAIGSSQLISTDSNFIITQLYVLPSSLCLYSCQHQTYCPLGSLALHHMSKNIWLLSFSR
jgi:hypothetical protein